MGGPTNSYWDAMLPHVGESGGILPKIGSLKPLESGRDPRERFDKQEVRGMTKK